MKTYWYLVIFLLLTGMGTSAWADRELEPAETEALLRTLTGSPRKYWIPFGTITARHLEYRRGDDYFAQSTETVTFDDQRYRWEITMDQEDSAGEAIPAAENRPALKIPDKLVNQKRLFAWDGQTYTRYYPNAEYASVSGSPQDPSSGLLGPLSAGIVPWGHGDFEISKLLSRRPTAVETEEQGQKRIRLRWINETISPALENTIVLAPEKNYAALSFVMGNEGARIKNTYTDYALYATHWVPRIIRTERLLKTPNASELISYEDWQFTQISVQEPGATPFRIKLKNGTLVEMHQPAGRRSFLYHASDNTNVSEILEEKLSIQNFERGAPQNCATAAVRHLARRFSLTIPEEKIAPLVAQGSGQTSLFQLKQNLEQAGLYCLAVRTDLDTLRTLSGCTVIVHFPGPRHYVILDRIDQDLVWTIDLTSRKFYWKRNIREFIQDWSEGTALLVADKPTHLPIHLQTIDSMKLYDIQGGDFEKYSCNELIQEQEFLPCPVLGDGVICMGTCYVFQRRYGCIEDEAGGICSGTGMEGYAYSTCKNHPYIYGFCVSREDWKSGSIRACE